MNVLHEPILCEKIAEYLTPALKEGSWFIDATAGSGGHSLYLSERLPPSVSFLLVDRDPASIAISQQRLAEESKRRRIQFWCTNYSEITAEKLREIVVPGPVMGCLADLGYSSDQLDNPERGLSFLHEGPLDMRLTPEDPISVMDYLNQVSEFELARVLYEYGEERYSRQIARRLIDRRNRKNLPRTTKELAELVWEVVPGSYRHGRIHPATRTFQALRIEINHELDHLKTFLNHGNLFLHSEGRLAIMSFHSLEDRMVKREFSNRDVWKPLHKKTEEASESEVERNPRARSAKLRVAEKLGG